MDMLWSIKVQFPAEEEIFSLPVSMAYPASYPNRTSIFFPKGKRVGAQS
jgi:hypothetical protein